MTDRPSVCVWDWMELLPPELPGRHEARLPINARSEPKPHTTRRGKGHVGRLYERRQG